ncbi:fibronectin type III domain-containing protein [Arsenicibacter rosenii]|uniref:Fibronectin type-III domain-containing protein n=1 Tax=Arsenicibacter rosenii TaxID=1750698 RepID=A0A1S2VSW7_9BACT|nr:fibronectin type III domain-containing protein [Arsenicibacter rosenii]OIN61008.1 hypothetical protein BLX24_02710 [Arsenicibacter rosenii]
MKNHTPHLVCCLIFFLQIIHSSATASNDFLITTIDTAQCPKVASLFTLWRTPATAFLVWGSSGKDAAYECRWRETGTQEWNVRSDIKVANLIINNLKGGKQYEWQVRALCSGSVFGAYSDVMVFTAMCTPPQLPSLSWVKPDEAQLNWNISGEANTYNLRWRPSSVSLWNTITNITTNTYRLTGLTNKTLYQWQVQSVCEDGSLSDFSAVGSFYTACTPPLYSLIEAASPTSAYLAWPGLSGLTYKIDWRKAGETTWNSLTTLSNNSTLSNLQPETTYQYRLQSICTSEISSGFTAIQQFTTGCYFDTFAYTDNITSNAARIRWSAPLQGQRFQVRWRVQGTQDWIISEILRTNSFYLTNLANATTYEWQLRAICTDQSSTEYGRVNEFTTQCSIPCCTKNYNLNHASILRWESFELGANFRVRWREAGSLTWNLTDLQPGWYIQLNNLIDGHYYEWQVQTICRDGNESAFSPVTSFTFNSVDCDPQEPNNTPETATPVTSLTFTSPDVCLDNPLDQDWYKYSYLGQDYYILVSTWSNSANPANNTSKYRLYLNIAHDTLTIETQSVNSSQTDTYLFLYNADRRILLAENDDTNGPFSRIIYTLPEDCMRFYTIKSGSWNDPACWSCNQIPGQQHDVQILHRITVPANYTAQAAKVTYGNGGVLLFGAGAKLRVYK